MADFLLVSEAVAPVDGAEAAEWLAAFAWALANAKYRVTLVALGDPERVARVPGMARRLRKVPTMLASGTLHELPLYEGRIAAGHAQLYVLGLRSQNRGEIARALASAMGALVRDGLARPEVLVGWGETSAVALAETSARARVFFLPERRALPPLDSDEETALGLDAATAALAEGSLLALGAFAAHAIVLPSPSAVRCFERQPGLARRPSDEPLAVVRLGCDEPPHDPATDPELPSSFAADNTDGKEECRKSLGRALQIPIEDRTLLVATTALTTEQGGGLILEALREAARGDLAAVIPETGSAPALLADARALAQSHPGTVAFIPEDGTALRRKILAGADALLLADPDDRIGRAGALGLRYGALPIAIDAGACADFLVDYDPASATGSALLYASAAAPEAAAALRRAVNLRAACAANPSARQSLLRSLLAAAPRWAAAVAALEQVCAEALLASSEASEAPADSRQAQPH